MTDVIGGTRVGAQMLIQGGETHVRTLLEACLAESERAKGVDQGIHEALFREALVASVRHDQELQSPSTLGVSEDRTYYGDRNYESNFVTRNGNVVD